MADTVTLKLPPALQELLRCPACRARLVAGERTLACTNGACARTFAVVRGVPVLLNESSSAFALDVVSSGTVGTPRRRGRLHRLGVAAIPRLSLNVKAAANFRKFAGLLPAGARVLVIGSGVEDGEGMGALRSSLQLVRTDVLSEGTVDVTCDAHDLPFGDESFDGVVLQAVLEHVADPCRCAEEAYRVLKKGGVVYAETPFMQQVHAGRYDFTRFTHLGHRRLFRRFTEIDSGASCGPGMALAWSWRYFLQSFVRSRRARLAMLAIAGFTAFPLLWFDRWLVEQPGALDAASVTYFLGRKSHEALDDRELVRQYRGLNRS
jgi:SAM-dependent methyltransferase